MKALEVATALNNASLESKIWVNALGQERDALTVTPHFYLIIFS